MQYTRNTIAVRVASALLVASAVGVGLTACGAGAPPQQLLQQKARESGAIPDGASVTGGSVSSGQTSGWYGGTSGTAKFGK